MTMEKAIIVAVADDMAIGRGNDMPWHISEDLKYFKRTTLGCPVIMGSRTFRSIGSRPLPGRTNIVISRRPLDPPCEGVIRVESLEQAYEAAERSRDRDGNPPARCFVIGGGRTYAEAIADADLLYVTHVHTLIPDADTRFPTIDPGIWQRVSTSEQFTDSSSGIRFEWAIYGRIPSPEQP